MKKKIMILGSTGMLGNAVTKHFMSQQSVDLITTYRTKEVAFSGEAIYFDVLKSGLDTLPSDVDYVINCVGIIKPFMKDSIENAIYINALFPWKLADWCEDKGTRLIHITTDCVFSGNKGKYVESDLHDALDDYGKSKSLGECVDKAMVLRTSIIGEEIHKNASLIAWAKSQKGKTINGYTTHFWNGITTKQYGAVCQKIIENEWYERGLFHIYASDDVTKYQMMEYFNEKYNLGLTINAMAPTKCDRTMRTEKDLCRRLSIPTVKEMIMDI